MPTEFGKAEVPGDLIRASEWTWRTRAERDMSTDYLEALFVENIS